MIRVKVGRRSYDWIGEYGDDKSTLGHIGDLTGKEIMLFDMNRYDTYIVNDAHKQPNIRVFAVLCKQKNKQLLVGGMINPFTKDLLDMADEYEKVV